MSPPEGSGESRSPVTIALDPCARHPQRDLWRVGLGRGGDEKFLIEENVVVDKESLVSALRYIGLPHTHTCQPAAGGTPSIPLPSSS